MRRSLLFFLLTISVLCAQSSSLFAEDALTPAEQRQLDDAKAAWKQTPAGRAAAETYAASLKEYRQDRAKFPDDRDPQVSLDYRNARNDFESAQRQALLKQNPALGALLERAEAAAKAPNPALLPIEDVPGLPRVLLIGDSISIGYTLEVRRLLKGKANVHRIPQNGGATDVGLDKMAAWLADGDWDVIHFNFGLHDAKYWSETTQRSTREQYAANLRTLVTQMKATGARLIFATTTPVPKDGNLAPTRRFDSIPERNKVAVQVMSESDVAIDDLYSTVLPVLEQVGRPNDVHFQQEGYDILAKAVAKSISAELPDDQPQVDAAERSFDVIVYGGTAGGVTAAVQAARMGQSVLLIEPGRHLGGMTSGGLGATDFKNADAVGGLAREFYRRVKEYYADPAVWKYERPEEYHSHRHDPEAEVMFHFEPHVAEEILADLARESGVQVRFGERLDLDRGVVVDGHRIDRVRMESGREYHASMFVDATYEGDLMALAGVSYQVGREANSVYGETLNGVQLHRHLYSGHKVFRPISPFVVPGQPDSGLLFGVQAEGPGEEGVGDHRVQAYCFRLCLTEVPENRVPFPEPDNYDPTRYELLLRYLQSDGTDRTFPDHPEPREIENPALGRDPYIVIMPNRKTDMNTKGALSSNLVGMNYKYPDGDYATRERITAAHRDWHQGMLWFLQNDPRVPEKYREPLQTWGLAKDEFVDTDHWPHQLYVREARRMIGDFVMTEHHCLGDRAIEDSVGLGCYTMDSHITQRYVDSDGWVRNEGTIGAKVPQPYPISYRTLVPQRNECENLLVPVCCSATHVAYGSLRMEPVFMILGQSAATAAVLAIHQDCAVQDVSYARLQKRLMKDGQRLNWPLQWTAR